MSEKKLAKVFYADLWGLRKEKYEYLFGNDVKTTKWQELKPVSPYYFFVPKDFALQAEYERFWKVTDIFKKWSFGVTTSRDHFVVGFTKEEIIQKLRTFIGSLPDDLVKEGLKLKDTGTWKVSETRQKVKGKRLEDNIYPYAYRPFDNRWICYEPALIERNRFILMKHLLKDNIAICTNKILAKPLFKHAFISKHIGDNTYVSNITKERTYFFPLYLYPDEMKLSLRDPDLIRGEAISKDGIPIYARNDIFGANFTPEFLQAIKESLGLEPMPEDIFYYIYAVLYSPTYRKRYEEFLKIDFPRIPLPSSHDAFKKLSNLGKELIDLHLLKHPSLDKTEIGFPKGGSNKVEKVTYDEQSQKVFLNKEQYFEGISKYVWEYHIGAYQVMEKYLKDRKGRKLSLDEINHYMKIAKAIRLTIELQEKIDDVQK